MHCLIFSIFHIGSFQVTRLAARLENLAARAARGEPLMLRDFISMLRDYHFRIPRPKKLGHTKFEIQQTISCFAVCLSAWVKELIFSFREPNF